MKLKIIEYNGFIKILTIISGLIVIGVTGLNLFIDMFIPGLVPIAFSINLFGLGLKDLNIFKESEQKIYLTSGFILIFISILNLYVGIEQIQIY